jgi:CTP synthase (UTP-ammonia lyase)
MITKIDIEFIRNTTDDCITENKYDKIANSCTVNTRAIVSNHIYNIPLPNKTTIVNYFKSLIDNLK